MKFKIKDNNLVLNKWVAKVENKIPNYCEYFMGAGAMVEHEGSICLVKENDILR